MHVRKLCLCPDCHRVATESDDEHRQVANAIRASLHVKRSLVEQLAAGIVRRIQPLSA